MKDTIIIHCSATRAGRDFTATDIDRWHRQRGFRSIGYHFVIRLDGTIEPEEMLLSTGALYRLEPSVYRHLLHWRIGQERPACRHTNGSAT